MRLNTFSQISQVGTSALPDPSTPTVATGVGVVVMVDVVATTEAADFLAFVLAAVVDVV